MRGLAQVLIHIFFRGVAVETDERLPRHGPVLVVANHTNGLVDGLLLMAALGRFPRFLGKSTLFRIPLLWPFLKLAGVIPVYRASDGSTERNAAAFAASTRVLAEGDVIAIFPEGISHDEASVQPLRTGAAWLALEADADARVDDVAIVAVGLIYDHKPTFRSRALVRIGVPSPVSAWRDRARQDPAGTVRQLTKAMAGQLGVVSPPFVSWMQADELAQIADTVVRDRDEPGPDVDLARRAGVAELLASMERRPGGGDRLAALRTAFRTYRRDLELIGLDDAQVASRLSPGALRWTVGWSLIKVVIAVPLTLLGVVVHVIPFEIVKQLGKMPSNEGIKATVKLLGCFFLFLVTYAVLGVVAGLSIGPWAGAAAVLLAPFCGYVALRAFERVRRVGGLLRGYETLRDRPDVLGSVVEHRRAVVATARALLGSE